MSEKEFLIEFAKMYEGVNLRYDTTPMLREDCINRFLAKHHQTYFEVEFIKKEYEGEVDWEKVHPIECANQDRNK